MNIKINFGENLKYYRKKKQFSQEQLSEKADISVKHLSAIERGLNFVSAELLEKFSKFLEVPTYLFFVKEAEIIYDDVMLSSINKKIEKHLLKAIEEFKIDIKQNA